VVLLPFFRGVVVDLAKHLIGAQNVARSHFVAEKHLFGIPVGVVTISIPPPNVHTDNAPLFAALRIVKDDLSDGGREHSVRRGKAVETKHSPHTVAEFRFDSRRANMGIATRY
jgi:hypothetical protein